jgi:4,5-DOPA dioxygenase extradiol
VAQAGGAAAPSTIHDFGRFDDRLFQMRYPAPGDPALAARAVALVTAAGMPAAVDPRHGLDHGVWVPLMLMLPGADIPVVPFSVQPHRGAAHSYRVGQALAPLRDEGVLIMGSGSYTHDLSRFRGRALDGATPDDVAEFAGWFDRALMHGRIEDLLAYRLRAPHAEENHPTEEHLLPLFVALGAASGAGGGAAEHLHESATYGVLRMDAYAFH